MKKIITLTAVAILMAGCTVSEDKARGAVQSQGMEDVKLGGPALLGCAEGDTFTRTFEAKGANNTQVKGVVCSGLFKGATVRITNVKAAPVPKREPAKW